MDGFTVEQHAECMQGFTENGFAEALDQYTASTGCEGPKSVHLVRQVFWTECHLATWFQSGIFSSKSDIRNFFIGTPKVRRNTDAAR